MSDAVLRLTTLAVFIQGLTLDAEIGLYEHERGRTQPLSVDVELQLSAAVTHDIHDAVNYESLAAKARALAAAGHVELVETFAERLAAACLEHPRALQARVRIRKPEAIAGADAAGVELTARKA